MPTDTVRPCQTNKRERVHKPCVQIGSSRKNKRGRSKSTWIIEIQIGDVRIKFTSRDWKDQKTGNWLPGDVRLKTYTFSVYAVCWSR